MAPSSSSKQPSKGDNDNNESKDNSKVPAPPLVLINSQWLTQVTSRIRARPIPWEGYARADLVSNEELKLIRSIDGKSNSEAEKILDERGEEYASLYLRLLGKLSRTDTLQQVLVLVNDMLEGRDDRVHLFFKAAEKGQGAMPKGDKLPWSPLVKLLDIQDDFAQLKAAQFLSLLLVCPTSSASSTLTTAPTAVISRLLTFLSSLINSTTSSSNATAGSGLLHPPSSVGYADGNGADIAIQLLEALLRTRQFRREVWKDEMRKQGQEPKEEEEEVKKSKDDEDDDDDKENGDGKQTKKVKHGQVPGLIRGLVYILQAALVAPQGSGSGNATPQYPPREGGSSSSSSNSNNRNNGSSSNNNSNSNSRRNDDNEESSDRRAPSAPISPQIQYQVIFCFWLLSFDESIAADINNKFGLIPILVDLARAAVKEKVIRVSIATLKNLLAKAPERNSAVMLGCKLLSLVELLSERKWSDDEIEEDLSYLKSELGERLKSMSTFDEYLSELSSGSLSWDNPAHLLDDFWKANASKLLEASSSSGSTEEASADNFKAKQDGKDGDQEDEADENKGPKTGLSRLLSLLSSSTDPTTLAVACHDLGKIIQFTDNGRKKINSEKDGRGKIEIMKLMNHEDGEVKFRALSTVGRLMSASWR